MDGRRTGAQGCSMAHAHVHRKLALKRIHMRAQRRYPVGAEGLIHKRDFFVAKMWRRQPDALGQLSSKNDIHRASLCVQHRNVVDLVFVHQRQHRGCGGVLFHHVRGL